MTTVPIARLDCSHGEAVDVLFDHRHVKELAQEGEVDAFIVGTDDGFTPLGVNRRFLASDLGIPEEEIRRVADWNCAENPRVTLVALHSRRDGSRLRGVILAASEMSHCYKRFSTPRYSRPYRDFFYNVTFEALAIASGKWGARRIAISHLSGSGSFTEDIATCNAEALAHYCDAKPSEIDSFIFSGCCISAEHLAGIRRLNSEAKTGAHRAILTEAAHRDGCELMHLDWTALPRL